MKTKKIKLARVALRWGLGALVIGITSFVIAIALIQNPLNTPLYVDILAMSGLVLAALGFISTLLVSLTFLPGILRFVTQNTQQHLSQNNKSYRSAISGLFRGAGLLFVALFEVWAFLVVNSDHSENEDTEIGLGWRPYGTYGSDAHADETIWYWHYGQNND